MVDGLGRLCAGLLHRGDVSPPLLTAQRLAVLDDAPVLPVVVLHLLDRRIARRLARECREPFACLPVGIRAGWSPAAGRCSWPAPVWSRMLHAPPRLGAARRRCAPAARASAGLLQPSGRPPPGSRRAGRRCRQRTTPPVQPAAGAGAAAVWVPPAVRPAHGCIERQCRHIVHGRRRLGVLPGLEPDFAPGRRGRRLSEYSRLTAGKCIEMTHRLRRRLCHGRRCRRNRLGRRGIHRRPGRRFLHRRRRRRSLSIGISGLRRPQSHRQRASLQPGPPAEVDRQVDSAVQGRLQSADSRRDLSRGRSRRHGARDEASKKLKVGGVDAKPQMLRRLRRSPNMSLHTHVCFTTIAFTQDQWLLTFELVGPEASGMLGSTSLVGGSLVGGKAAAASRPRPGHPAHDRTVAQQCAGLGSTPFGTVHQLRQPLPNMLCRPLDSTGKDRTSKTHTGTWPPSNASRFIVQPGNNMQKTQDTVHSAQLASFLRSSAVCRRPGNSEQGFPTHTHTHTRWLSTASDRRDGNIEDQDMS